MYISLSPSMYSQLTASQSHAPAAAAQPADSGSGSDSGSDTSSTDLSNMFLQLLSTQLAAQSPFDPLDPNQFVGQLAQFQSLSELSQITQLLTYIASK